MAVLNGSEVVSLVCPVVIQVSHLGVHVVGSEVVSQVCTVVIQVLHLGVHVAVLNGLRGLEVVSQVCPVVIQVFHLVVHVAVLNGSDVVSQPVVIQVYLVQSQSLTQQSCYQPPLMSEGGGSAGGKVHRNTWLASGERSCTSSRYRRRAAVWQPWLLQPNRSKPGDSRGCRG